MHSLKSRSITGVTTAQEVRTETLTASEISDEYIRNLYTTTSVACSMNRDKLLLEMLFA